MFWVRAVFRIKMRARVGKRVFLVAGAGASGMDMHCKNGIAALRPVDRQPGDIRDDERSAFLSEYAGVVQEFGRIAPKAENRM